MSLFGGDSAPATDAEESDFDIEPIQPSSPPLPVYYDHVSEQRSVSGAGDSPLTQSPIHVLDTSPGADDIRYTGHSSTDEDDRPNRFQGTDRAWRHYTEQDRAVAHSLDQLRANDLSIHLYNAHALKARLRSSDLDLGGHVKPWDRKSKWALSKGDEKPWYPDRDWSAWPLAPENVPTGNELFGDNDKDDGFEGSTIRRIDPPKLSRDLEDELQALLLRTAKSQWTRRQTTPPLLSAASSRQASMSRTRSMSRDTSRVPESRRASPSDSAQLPHVLPPSAQPHQASSPPQSSQEAPRPYEHYEVRAEMADDEDQTCPRPVFSADDELSQRILRPTVRHLLSNLDDLLLSLHHQRQGQYSRNRDTSDTSDSSVHSGSRSRSYSSRHPSGRRALRRSRSASRHVASQDQDQDTAMPDLEEGDQGFESSDASRSTARRKRPALDDKPRTTRRLGLRDWSDVLGVAAMTGWDRAIIDRTMNRCQTLFNERMTLHTMTEIPAESSSDDDDDNGDAPRSAREGYYCPEPLCGHHMLQFEKPYRWREHLKRVHKYDRQRITDAEEILAQKGTFAPSKRFRALNHNPRAWVPPDPLRCPHCAHERSVYSTVSRLIDHLKRTHKYDPRTQSPPDADSQSFQDSDDADIETDDDMCGGVHNDRFLKPIGRKAGARPADAATGLSRADGRKSRHQSKSEREILGDDVMALDGQ